VWGSLSKRVDSTTQTPQSMLLKSPPAGASAAEMRFSRLREGLTLPTILKPSADGAGEGPSGTGGTKKLGPGGRSGGGRGLWPTRRSRGGGISCLPLWASAVPGHSTKGARLGHMS